MEHSSDLVMHVGETLEENRRHAVEDAIKRLIGVYQAQFNTTRPHLMLVSYNRAQISSFEIMDQLSGENSQHRL